MRLDPNRFALTDLINEALAGVGARPTRLILTVLGTVLGIASLVVTIGLSQTAAGQISEQFDAVKSTELLIKTADQPYGTEKISPEKLPMDSEARLKNLNGVVAVAAYGEVKDHNPLVESSPIYDPEALTPNVTLFGTSPNTPEAIRTTVKTGRFFDEGHLKRADRVAVLGASAAKQLGITRVDTIASLTIDGILYNIIGILNNSKREAQFNDAILIPLSCAQLDFALAAPDTVKVKIALGAGDQLKKQAAFALNPNNPKAFIIIPPLRSSELEHKVKNDLNIIFLVLGAIALLAGALGIANVTLLSVIERVGEIGLRRALGATKPHIAGQFMLESSLIGALGGLVGSSLALLGVLIISVVNHWTPVASPALTIGGILFGTLLGLLAGVYPALKASRIEPAQALKNGT